MSENTYSEVENVITKYDLKVKKITPETLKEKKAVWWIDSASQKFILKRMPLPKDRFLFLLSAIRHLRNNGIHLPEIYQARDGDCLVEAKERMYILMEAITGKVPDYNVPREMALIMQEMARFHQASRNFVPPQPARIRQHLGTWEKRYSETVMQLEAFKKTALLNPAQEFAKGYLADCDYFIKEASDCLEALRHSGYADWVAKVRREVNLCHQDFAAGNLGLVNGEIYVYDLDSITFDLPARDLRKIMNKVMKKRGAWDLSLTREMLQSYQAIMPLSRDEYDVLFTDLRFPHLFYGITSKYFDNRNGEWSPAKHLSKLKDIIKIEKSKSVVLNNKHNILDSIGL